MKRDDIIRMAREAGWPSFAVDNLPDTLDMERLERFASLVAAAEREACAKVCDDAYDLFFAEHDFEFPKKLYDQASVVRSIKAGVEFVTADSAAAIRARGQA